MQLSRELWFQLIGGFFGLGIAWGGIALGVFGVGRGGRAILVISVPIGVLLGLLLVKVLEAVHRILSELD